MRIENVNFILANADIAVPVLLKIFIRSIECLNNFLRFVLSC